MVSKQFEINVRESFRMCKSDIVALQEQIAHVAAKQTELMKMIGENRAAIVSNKAAISSKPKTKTVVKKQVIVKKAKKTYVGHKETKLLHDPNSPFAKNIKPKNKVIFKSKVAALNQGYKLASSLQN